MIENLTENDRMEIRAARNSYRSAVRAADGFVSGNRVASARIAEKHLREMLWKHRDALVEAVSEKIG
jgi:hypothetical protein